MKWDPTSIVTIDRRVRWTYPPDLPKPALSLSKGGKGASRLMAVLNFQVKGWFEEGFSFSPLRETGEGNALASITWILGQARL